MIDITATSHRKLSRCCLLLTVISFFLFPCLSTGAGTAPKQVLVFHSYHKGLSWTDSLVKGIDDGLQGFGVSIDISHEFMDTKRIFSNTYLEQLVELYKAKFNNSDIDIILTTDDHAFNFLRKHHGELFPGTPVVFCGVNSFNSGMLDGLPTFTGVLEAFDIPATLNIALDLHPKAQRFVVISDQTLTGQANKDLFLKAVEKVSRKVDVLFLDNHTMDEVRDEVSRLGEKDLAIWLVFTADRLGNYFSFRRSAKLISEVSTAPMYSFWDFNLGYGAVGGKLASGYYQGMKAAELATRILHGEPVSRVKIVAESPNRYMFDYLQLQRFDVELSSLPEGAVVINQPESFFSRYKTLVVAVLAGFVALTAIILLLLHNVAVRRKANKEISKVKNRFQGIFNDAAVGLLEADFSRIFDRLQQLAETGTGDVAVYLRNNRQLLTDSVSDISLLDCNRAAQALYGAATKEQLLHAPAAKLRLFNEDDVLKIIGGYLSKQEQMEWETVTARLDGTSLNVLMTLSFIGTGAAEGSKSVIISAVDITERKQYTEDLRLSEDRFRTLFNTAASGIALLDTAGNYLRVNDAFCKMIGYSRQQLEKMNWRDITHPDDKALTTRMINDLLEGDSLHPVEKRYVHRDGHVVWALLNVGLNTGSDGKPLNYVAQMQDISEMKHVQAHMRLREERYRQIFEADLSGFYIANPKGKILLCNQVFAGILGYDSVAEVLGENIAPCYDSPKNWEALVEELHVRRKIEDMEAQLIRCNGEPVNVLCNSIGRFDDKDELIEIQGHIMDITGQKKLEMQLVRAQKMEAIGLMAGGVAHDLNNILSGIINYPELMLATLDENNPLRKPLESVRESGHRAAAVVADLLTVARTAANVREHHNLFTLAREYLDSPECHRLTSSYPDITLHLEGNPDGLTILCSPVHIKKCLMNLVTNAMEAIEGSGRVVVTVYSTTRMEHRDGQDLPTDYAVISVKDNGPGISDEDREHIFEPFYTKKVMGKSGTGLGLAVAWNTVMDHGGDIRVDSSLHGTTFTLFFPRLENGPSVSESIEADIVHHGHGEHILVVDDEPVLREIARQILEKNGYTVDTVNSGEAAVKFLGEKSVDLVLLDMFMEPGINGRQTYEQILVLHPGQRAIIASGYSKSDDVKKAMRLGVGGFIEKPYTMDELCRAVHQELFRAGKGAEGPAQ